MSSIADLEDKATDKYNVQNIFVQDDKKEITYINKILVSKH